MTNKALVGSVNANRRHFEAAVATLESLPASLLDDIVTAVHDVGDYRAAFAARTDGGTREQIKTAVEFGQP
jgi:hypothetical protein